MNIVRMSENHKGLRIKNEELFRRIDVFISRERVKGQLRFKECAYRNIKISGRRCRIKSFRALFSRFSRISKL